MVLDNIDDGGIFFCSDGESPLEARLPQTPNGSIVIASRNSDAAINLLGNFGAIMKLNVMSEEEALTLLRTRISLNTYKNDAKQLVHALEYIPLVII